MRKYKKGEHVSVVLPDNSKVSGVVVRISPDRRNIVVRVNADFEILTETRFLRSEEGQK